MKTFAEGSSQWLELEPLSGVRSTFKHGSITNALETSGIASEDRVSAALISESQGVGTYSWRLARRVGNELILESQIAVSTLGMPEEVVADQACSDPTGRLIHELRVYLWGLAGKFGDESLITSRMADLALKMCGRLLCNVDGDMAIPDAGPGPNGEILFIWRRGEHYLSLEIQEVGLHELFYRNESSGEIWGADIDPLTARFDTSVIEKLKLFPPGR